MPAKKCPLRPGCAYSFQYPRHNFHGILSSFERRLLLVSEVRDLTREPLDAVTFEMQPLLKRSRWLVTGQDLDKHAERSFYVEQMRAIIASSEGQATGVSDTR